MSTRGAGVAELQQGPDQNLDKNCKHATVTKTPDGKL